MEEASVGGGGNAGAAGAEDAGDDGGAEIGEGDESSIYISTLVRTE